MIAPGTFTGHFEACPRRRSCGGLDALRAPAQMSHEGVPQLLERIAAIPDTGVIETVPPGLHGRRGTPAAQRFFPRRSIRINRPQEAESLLDLAKNSAHSR